MAPTALNWRGGRICTGILLLWSRRLSLRCAQQLLTVVSGPGVVMALPLSIVSGSGATYTVGLWTSPPAQAMLKQSVPMHERRVGTATAHVVMIDSKGVADLMNRDNIARGCG